MKIANVAKSPSFARALTKCEESNLRQLTQEALSGQHLGIDRVKLTMFDFCFPSGKYYTPVGTSFSKSGMNEVADFANTYFATNGIQFGPQGKVSSITNYSPYSSPNFSYGVQNISPERLVEDGLLTDKYLNDSSYTKRKSPNDAASFDSCDYESVFSNDGIIPLLIEAYNNFNNLPVDSELKIEFEQFKKDNEYWLERDCIYEALVHKYGTENLEAWSEEERNLYADENDINEDIVNEAKQIKGNNGINEFEFNEFIQFIADRQQKQTKTELNKKDIKLYGDCPICFSQKDIWAHRSAFYEDGKQYACDDESGNLTCWGAAPDLDKLKSDNEDDKNVVLDLFRNKFATYLKRYDRVRIDAAWQLVTPRTAYPKTDSEGNMQYDESGHLLGDTQKDHEPIDELLDVLKEEAKKANFDEKDIYLELLGGRDWDTKKHAEDELTNMKFINIMQYMNPGWGFPRFYRNSDADVNKHPSEMSIGTHDNVSARVFAQNLDDEKIKIMLRELKLDKNSLNSVKQRLAALFAMLFTNTPDENSEWNGEVNVTISDAVGSERRINNPNNPKEKDNWKFRLGKNWEREYFVNLSEGFGFNLPQALSMALRAKEGDSRLAEQLDKYAKALKQGGKDVPMTKEEANQMDESGSLDTIA